MKMGMGRMLEMLMVGGREGEEACFWVRGWGSEEDENEACSLLL